MIRIQDLRLIIYYSNRTKRLMSVVRCPLSVANLTLIEPKLDQVSVVSGFTGSLGLFLCFTCS